MKQQVTLNELFKKQLFALADSIQQPVVILAPEFNELNEIVDFKYVFVNSFAEKSNRLSAALTINNLLLTLFPSHRVNGVFQTLKLAYETGNILNKSIENYRGGPADSVVGNFSLNSSRIGNYLVVNWIDNSLNLLKDLKMDTLKASNEELEQFAYIASHDLQEPLRMVTSFTQLLQQRYSEKLDKDANEFINFAVDGANRMKELIDNLLIYSRVTSKPIQKYKVDIKSIIDEILIEFQYVIAEKNIRISFDKLPKLSSEKFLLKLIFSNLISNAIKYSKPGEPHIIISESDSDSEWLFSIADNGIGIDENHFHKIFLIFQRLHGRNSYPGTGIGLAICKKSVEKLGGRIWVESKPGAGSTFYFTTPREE